MLLLSCQNTSSYDNIELENQELQIAVPIIDSDISVNELAEKDQSSYLRIEPDGKVTAIYSGELIKDSAVKLFPPLPFEQELVITASGEFLEIPFPDKYDIKKARFKNTNLSFKYSSSFQGNIDLKISTNHIKDPSGNFFMMDYSWLSDGNSQNVVSSSQKSVAGYLLEPEDNSLAFDYEATDESGNPVTLDYLAMVIDEVVFSYVEGYFGKHRFDIDGDIITIGLFGNWISGGLFFEDPRINLEVENAFGFPVRSEVEFIKISSINGITRDVESVYINQGIDFDYPSLSEVGVTKTTEFSFDKENSNVGTLLNDKPSRVTYEMNALANPDDVYDPMEFIAEESFFSVNIGVELPLLGKVNDLVLADTFDFSLTKYEEIDRSEFKLITKNEFPVDIYLQAHFLDINDNILDSLVEEPLYIEAPELQSNGRTSMAFEKLDTIIFDSFKMDKILATEKIRVQAKMSSNEVSEESLLIYDDYIFSIKMGAILDVKN